MTNHIPRSAVEAAVKFVKFAADQVATLYTEFSDRTALAPNLAKILLAAERKGGKISIRDAQLAFSQKFRPSAQMARSWFGELVALGYGVVKKSDRKSVIFEIVAKSTDHLSTVASKSLSTSVSASTVSDPSAISCLHKSPSTVDYVDENLPTRLQTEPIQEEGFRSYVDNDPVDSHPSEKIENENVSDCVKFMRTAISENDPQVANYKTAPKLKIKFGSRFTNKFLLGSTLTWEVQVVTSPLQFFQLRFVFCQRLDKVVIILFEETSSFIL